MIRLKDLTKVNWVEELPDDPANPVEGLGEISLVDSNNLFLFG